MCVGGQSVIEYVIILAVVAIVSIVFTKNFLYDKKGKLNLFVGYVTNAQGAMR